MCLATTTTTTTATSTTNLLQVNDECDPRADTCDDLKGLACSMEVYKCVYMTTTTTIAAAEEEPAGEQATTVGGGTTTTSKTTILSQQGQAGDREVNISSSTDGSNPASDGLPPDEDAATTTMPTIIGGAVAGFAVLAALIWFAIHMQKGNQDAHPQDEEGRPNVDAANRAHFDNPTFTRGGNLERASAAQQDVGAAEIVYVEADPNQPAEYDEAKRLAAVYAEVQDPPTVVYAAVIDPNVTYTPLANGKATYAAANSEA